MKKTFKELERSPLMAFSEKPSIEKISVDEANIIVGGDKEYTPVYEQVSSQHFEWTPTTLLFNAF